jgi:hypothetical protein
MASFDEKPRRARTVDSYIASLDGSIHPALNTLDGGVIYDQRSKVYVAEPPMYVRPFPRTMPANVV